MVPLLQHYSFREAQGVQIKPHSMHSSAIWPWAYAGVGHPTQPRCGTGPVTAEATEDLGLQKDLAFLWGLSLVGLEMEPEQGQLAPLQGQAAAAATAGSSEDRILPDFRRQLGVILQTVGKAQVEKMLRELVKEQEQQGRMRRRKRVTRSPRQRGNGIARGTWTLMAPCLALDSREGQS